MIATSEAESAAQHILDRRLEAPFWCRAMFVCGWCAASVLFSERSVVLMMFALAAPRLERGAEVLTGR